MKWICQDCGYIIELTGYTEICPQCWQATMKGVSLDERKETKENQSCN